MVRIDQAQVGNDEFKLEKNSTKVVVSSNGRTWENVADLLKDTDEKLSECPTFLAHAIFHILLNEDYQFIENDQIPTEKNRYMELVKKEAQFPDRDDYLKPSAFGGPYNIEVLHPAEVRNGLLEFFVKQRGTSIPMVVRCPLRGYAPEKIEIDFLPKLKSKEKSCDIS